MKSNELVKKKMDYEQKKIVLEWARKKYEQADDVEKRNWEFVFPELKESEDERIRKEIIGYLNNRVATAEETELLYFKRWIAYLEKQKDETQRQFNLGIQAGREEVMYELEKQKEQNDEDEESTDFTIYHPLKNGKGKYECIPYSFYGSLTSFSEDKDLIDFLRTCFYTEEECEEWIEKQEEQKHAEKISVSEELYEHIRNTCACIDDAMSSDTMCDMTDYLEMANSSAQKAFDMVDKSVVKQPAEWTPTKEQMVALNWAANGVDNKSPVAGDIKASLRSLYNDIQSKLIKPAEWSEEDNEKIKRLRSIVNDCAFRNDALDVNGDYCDGDYEELDNWLTSLRPQPHWKPSEEQMEALRIAYEIGTANESWAMCVLKSLYNDLKKLM